MQHNQAPARHLPWSTGERVSSRVGTNEEEFQEEVEDEEEDFFANDEEEDTSQPATSAAGQVRPLWYI